MAKAHFRLNGTRGYNWYLELNIDGQVTESDVDAFLYFVANTVRGDGNVDAADMNILGQNWLMTGKSWADGDFNGDGKVDSIDLNEVATNWQWGVE